MTAITILAPVRNRSGIWVPLLVGLGAYAAVMARPVDLLNDGDTMWHLVAGRWIIEHRALPFHDPFTYTFAGQTWVPHEWLAEVAFWGAYGWLGWGGVIATAALAIAAAFALLTGALQHSLGPRRAAIGGVLALLLIIPHLLARPHVLALPFMVIWMAGVIRARDEGRVPPLALLPVMTLWCNLHGGFVIGLLFAGLLGAEAVLEAPAATRSRALRGWGIFVASATLAALVSPNGIDLFLLPMRLMRMGILMSGFSEWAGADFQHFEPLEVWIVLAILGAFSLRLRLPWSRTLMVLLLLHLALTHVRNVELLGIIGTLLLASPLAAQLGPAPGAGGGSMARSDPRARAPAPLAAAALLAAVVALAVVSTAVALDRRGVHPRGTVAPVAAVEAARRAGLDGPVFNWMGFAGYLTFVGIPTFVDSRADLFGNEFLTRAADASFGIGNALPELLDQYAVGWTLLEPRSAAVSLLDHLPGWERVYADDYAVIHRRKTP
jgi:hypothetical protein